MGNDLLLMFVGEMLYMLGVCVFYWLMCSVMLIVDLYLGKVDLFWCVGIGLFSGGMGDDFVCLIYLLQQQCVDMLWILGDVLYGVVYCVVWYWQWQGWCEQYLLLQIGVLVGNYDCVLFKVDFGIELLGESVQEGLFLLCYDLCLYVCLYVLCGYLYLLVWLLGMQWCWLVFWLCEDFMILLVFLWFIVGIVLVLINGEWLVVCVEDEVIVLLLCQLLDGG